MSHSSWGLSARLLLVAALVAVVALPATAQQGFQGKVNITVVDAKQLIVEGAGLELQDLATNEIRHATTGAAGTYTFANLPIGNYKLTISKDGFKTQVLSPVVVDATLTTDVKTTLEIGAVTQTVQVEGHATAVETTSNIIGTTISTKQIEDLPLGGRNVSEYSTLSPGYSGAQGSNQGTWNGLPVIAEGNSVDGVIGSASRMKFSGNSAPAVTPRLEAVEEMTVSTDSLDLGQGYGQASMQVNFISRRGTNNYHAHIWEDFRNSYLNANSWRNDVVGLPKAHFELNDFGGTVGGPVLHNKLFFFASLGMSKQPGSVTATNSVLAAAAQTGNFTYVDSSNTTHTVNVLQIAQNCVSCGPLPSTVNSIVSSEISTINATLSGGTLSATSDPNRQQINWLTPNPTTIYYPSGRLDYSMTTKIHMSATFTDTHSNTPTNNAPFFPGSNFSNTQAGTIVNNYTAAYQMDWTFSPRALNQFRAGFLYNVNRFGYNAAPLYAQEPSVFWNFPGGTGSMSGQAAFQTPITSYYPVWNASDVLQVERGSHNFSFGGDFWREQDHYWNGPLGFANINLGLATGDPALSAFTINSQSATPTLPNANTTQQAEAEQLYAILVGRISGVSGQYAFSPQTGQYAHVVGAYNLDELSQAWGLFFQDSWRVKPTLTINYGLRWDFTGDDHDLGVAYHNASPDSIFGPTAQNQLFTPGALNGNPAPQLVARPHVYNAWNVAPQPALGIAWNPQWSDGFLGKLTGHGGTVIRAGYSLRKYTEPYQYFWDNASDFGQFFYQNFSLSPGTNGVGTFAPGSLTIASASNPPPNSFQGSSYFFSPTSYQSIVNESQFSFISGTPGVNGINPNIGQPYTESWNLGIQRSLGQGRALEIRYNGNLNLHQWISLNANEVNIFENGFLKEFINAQNNLSVCKTNAAVCDAAQTAAGVAKPNANSFADWGLTGQAQLPIMTGAFSGSSNTAPPAAGACASSQSGQCNNNFNTGSSTGSTFVGWLGTGSAGSFARRLSTIVGATNPYFCNLVGVSFTPCASNVAGFTGTGVQLNGASVPTNFFQANPFAAGNSIGYLTDAGYSNYHALQVDFRQRTWHGLQFDANYTWSHTLGISTPDDWTAAYTAFTLRNLRESYGPASFDVRHVFHANGTYDLPFGRGKKWLSQNAVLDRVVGGWTVGSIATYQTGYPFRLTSGFDTFNQFADSGVNLNGVTQQQLQSSVGVYRINSGTPTTFVNLINPQYLTAGSGANAAFITPNITPGTLAPVLWLYGPHGFYQDMAVTKAFVITERVRFNFQAEFLNAWNHPVFGNVSGVNSGSSANGSILSTAFMQGGINNSARQIELRANLEF